MAPINYGDEVIRAGISVGIKMGADVIVSNAIKFSRTIKENIGNTAAFIRMKQVILGKNYINLREYDEKNSDIRFVDWSRDFSDAIYVGEGGKRCFNLPYSTVALWGKETTGQISPIEGVFELETGDGQWEELSRRGFEEIQKHKIVYDQYDAADKLVYSIRLSGFDLENSRMIVQRATYKQQAKSNLIADFKYKESYVQDGESHSMRNILSREYKGRLPPLSDGRLANTIGVSVLVLFFDDDGVLRPLLHYRTGERQAMGNRGIQCTGTCAAFWPKSEQNWNADSFFEDEAWRAIQKDFGLPRSAIPGGLHLMGLLREHARLGKPQLFYYGVTDLPLAKLVEYRHRRQMDHVGTNQVGVMANEEFVHMSVPKLKDFLMKKMWTEESIRDHPFTHEATAMLTVLSREFGNYDQI